jgi:D-2-hydroxyglutarate dehydrogenase
LLLFSAVQYDFSLPHENYYEMVAATRERVTAEIPDAVVVGFGHVGDGNVHLNIVLPGARRGEVRADDVEKLESLLEPWVYSYVKDVKGSVSAEHGMGSMKAHLLEEVNGKVAANLMQQIKDVMDPNAILNPYKVLQPRGE